ncbi:MAG: PAS domain S-box protein [Verrucomicrobia bacterium]|nr:PAS domain S-box protein [Verrucomicrobiota bacterium]
MPLKRKLALITATTSVVALILACTAFFWYEWRSYNKDIRSYLECISAIIAENSVPSIKSGDTEGLERILATLENEPHIIAALIRTIDGRTLTEYKSADIDDVTFPASVESGVQFTESNLMHVSMPVQADNETIAHVSLLSDARIINDQFWNYLEITLGVMALSFLVAWLLSSRLQQIITTPLLKLAGLAKQISEQKDYSVRAPEVGQDETRQLVRAFNEMLTQIQARDKILRQSEDYLKTMLDSVRAGIIMVDAHTQKIITANACAIELIDKPREEIIGKHLTEFISFNTPHPAHPETAATNHRADVQALIKRYTDKGVPALLSRARIRWRNEDYEVNSLVEISKLKQTEAALAYERDLLKSLMDNIPDMIYFKNNSGRFTRINHAQANAFNLDHPDQAIGKTEKEILGHEEHNGTDEARTLNNGIPVIGEVRRKPEPDGSPSWFSVTQVPVRNTTGIITGLVGISRNITDQKQTEESLAAKATELERSNRELEQFAYVASHDLQEPLRMVASYTELLARRYRGKLDEDADEFIAFAVDGATRMQQLINDLLTYSRVSTSGKPFKPTDFNQSLEYALANLRMTINAVNAQINHEPLPTLPADSTQITQLFQNLIANALKFHSDDTPRIHISAGLVQQQQTKTSKASREWRFAIRDNGIGIDPAFKDKIFMIFQRLHGYSEFPGTGIGLAVCKKIVERHSGRIWVESEFGKGSSFYFTIPEYIDNNGSANNKTH